MSSSNDHGANGVPQFSPSASSSKASTPSASPFRPKSSLSSSGITPTLAPIPIAPQSVWIFFQLTCNLMPSPQTISHTCFSVPLQRSQKRPREEEEDKKIRVQFHVEEEEEEEEGADFEVGDEGEGEEPSTPFSPAEERPMDAAKKAKLMEKLKVMREDLAAFVYYPDKDEPRAKTLWTKKEDKALIDAISKTEASPVILAEKVGRAASSCVRRIEFLLKKYRLGPAKGSSIAKKQSPASTTTSLSTKQPRASSKKKAVVWTDEEDSQLVASLCKRGFNWSAVSKDLEKSNDMSVFLRYFSFQFIKRDLYEKVLRHHSYPLDFEIPLPFSSPSTPSTPATPISSSPLSLSAPAMLSKSGTYSSSSSSSSAAPSPLSFCASSLLFNSSASASAAASYAPKAEATFKRPKTVHPPMEVIQPTPDVKDEDYKWVLDARSRLEALKQQQLKDSEEGKPQAAKQIRCMISKASDKFMDVSAINHAMQFGTAPSSASSSRTLFNVSLPQPYQLSTLKQAIANGLHDVINFDCPAEQLDFLIWQRRGWGGQDVSCFLFDDDDLEFLNFTDTVFVAIHESMASRLKPQLQEGPAAYAPMES